VRGNTRCDYSRLLLFDPIKKEHRPEASMTSYIPPPQCCLILCTCPRNCSSTESAACHLGHTFQLCKMFPISLAGKNLNIAGTMACYFSNPSSSYLFKVHHETTVTICPFLVHSQPSTTLSSLPDWSSRPQCSDQTFGQ